MNHTQRHLFRTLFLLLTLHSLNAGQYFALSEGNFGQANASLWSLDETLTPIQGPLVWNESTNPMGDVGQSLTLYNHNLYVVMNGSHEVRILNLEGGANHTGDIDLPNTSPRYMAIHPESNRGFVSSWSLGALLIIDLTSNAVIDTLSLGSLPEQLLIDGNELYVSVPMMSDWSAENKILRIDLSGSSLEVTHTYDVIDGPGDMAVIGDQLYVTSIYYNDAWETFSGTSRINLMDHTVTMDDHGYYTNFTADIEILQGSVYRSFGNSIVPFNDDMSLNTSGALLDVSGIYAFTIVNDHIIVGSSDFVAPDLLKVFTLSGAALGSFNVGAFPSDMIYYDPNTVSLAEERYAPGSSTLGQNFPNPFNPATTIPFHLESPAKVKLSIYDLQGRLVRNLINDHRQAGDHSILWDGLNQSGSPVSSGVYPVVFEAGKHQDHGKVMLLR